MKQAFSIFLFLFPLFVFSQEKFEVHDTSGKLLVYFENDFLKESENGEVLYTIKGNLIFRGNSDNRKNIFLLVKMQELFSAGMGEVLSSNLKETIYTIHDGRFYKGQAADLNDNLLLGYYDSDTTGTFRMFNGKKDELAVMSPGDLSAAKMVALFYVLGEKFELGKSVEQREKEIQQVKPKETEKVATYGSIRRLWDTGMDQFEWDGQTLKRKWNSFDFEEWTFDGTTLERAWYPGDDEFTWDGKLMRRKWYTSPDEFEWDGRILRRRWGNDEFIIQGNVVKRYFDTSGKYDWEIEGDIPIPVIVLVIFNLLRK